MTLAFLPKSRAGKVVLASMRRGQQPLKPQGPVCELNVVSEHLDIGKNCLEGYLLWCTQLRRQAWQLFLTAIYCGVCSSAVKCGSGGRFRGCGGAESGGLRQQLPLQRCRLCCGTQQRQGQPPEVSVPTLHARNCLCSASFVLLRFCVSVPVYLCLPLCSCAACTLAGHLVLSCPAWTLVSSCLNWPLSLSREQQLCQLDHARARSKCIASKTARHRL